MTPPPPPPPPPLPQPRAAAEGHRRALAAAAAAFIVGLAAVLLALVLSPSPSDFGLLSGGHQLLLLLGLLEVGVGHGQQQQQLGEARGSTALLVIDVQACFLPPHGSLAVADGDMVIQKISELVRECDYDYIITSQDSHPPNHISFGHLREGVRYHTDDVESLAEYATFQYTIEANGATYDQVKWPAHCVYDPERDMDLVGAELNETMMESIRAWDRYDPCSDVRDVRDTKCTYGNFRKGMNPLVDSYSAFEGVRPTRVAAAAAEGGGFQVPDTGLRAWLTARAVRRVVVVGLASDFCVGATALDARRLLDPEVDVVVVDDATRPVDQRDGLARMQREWERHGVVHMSTDDYIEKTSCGAYL